MEPEVLKSLYYLDAVIDQSASGMSVKRPERLDVNHKFYI